MVDLIFIHFLSFQNMLVLDVQGVQVHKRQETDSQESQVLSRRDDIRFAFPSQLCRHRSIEVMFSRLHFVRA